MKFHSIFLVISFLLLINHGAFAGKAMDTDYTPEEVTALEELKSMVEDELEEDYMKTDEYLINFLRAKKLNIPKTAENIKVTMKWWRDAEMSNIMEESFPTLEKKYPFKVGWLDKEGRPVILMSFGRWNLRDIIISGQKIQILRYFGKMLESGLTKIREIREATGEDVNKFMILVDMNGYSFTTHGCLNCIPLILDFAKHLETYYVARSIRIYCINTPRLFIPVFELIKPLLSESTAKGFKIYASNKEEWKAELLKVTPKDELPVEYGGTGKKKAKTTTTIKTTTTSTTTTTEPPRTNAPAPARPKPTRKPAQTPPKPVETNLIPEEYDCEDE